MKFSQAKDSLNNIMRLLKIKGLYCEAMEMSENKFGIIPNYSGNPTRDGHLITEVETILKKACDRCLDKDSEFSIRVRTEYGDHDKRYLAVLPREGRDDITSVDLDVLIAAVGKEVTKNKPTTAIPTSDSGHLTESPEDVIEQARRSVSPIPTTATPSEDKPHHTAEAPEKPRQQGVE